MDTWRTAFDASATAVATRAEHRYALVALGLAIFAMWLFLHPYWGIAHDSILYTYAALARLHPESLANDIFLRFGSQDRYTLFSPLYAAAIRAVGLEPAAALLTLVAQVVFFGSAWQVARRFMSGPVALLSIGLLAVLPSTYGAHQIFRYTEDFITPRQLAEGFVLAALAASFARRYLLAGIAMLAAVALHPIMAAAGVAMLLTLHVAIPRPKLALLLGAAGAAVFVCGALLVPVAPLARIDDAWWNLLNERTPYILLEHWSFNDWARAVVPLTVLAVGRLLCRDTLARKVCTAGLIVAGSGLLLTFIGADLLRITVLTQMQSWRWLWLANVIAVLMIPLVARDSWAAGSMGRIAALLAATAWMFRADAPAIIVAALAVSAAAASSRAIEPRYARQLYRGALGVAIVALAFNLANDWLMTTLDRAFIEVRGVPLILEQWRAVLGDGLVPAALLVLAWWAVREGKPAAVTTVSVAALIACLVLIPSAWRSWSAAPYSKLHAAYADWRQRIPLDAEVFWPEDPLGPSFLLERASYISIYHTAGLVFSRAAALEMYERTQRIRPLFALGQFGADEQDVAARRQQQPDLRSGCRNSSIDFVVSSSDLKEPPLATLSMNAAHPNARLWLYRCSDFRP